jgi:hypothetical protein
MPDRDSDTTSGAKTETKTDTTGQPQLDWSQAEVKDGKLSVAVAGDPPPGWSETFEKTAALLGGDDWDVVRLKKQSVRVEGVRVGSEDKLRHFLESVVQQANATHEPEMDEAEDEETEESEEQHEEQAKDGSDDAEMTERFRSFGQQ